MCFDPPLTASALYTAAASNTWPTPAARRYVAAVSAVRSAPRTATRAAPMRDCPSGPISGSAMWRA